MGDFIDELRWRGRFHQATDEVGLRAHLAGGVRRGYIGFDPTADSLTVGNLTQIITLALFQRAGHQPVVIAGGGTGLIGDPSGKTAERQLRTREDVAANVEAQKRIFDRILDFAPGRATSALLMNNLDWLGGLSYLDALRDVGKHFSVNMMIQKDSVRERLHNRDQGISYTEFSYMILQAYDFLHLYEKHGVTLQMGGSDQWGNIVAGSDLIRRVTGGGEEAPAKAFGLTTSLITKADGTKFGKTESGAIWLTANRPGESSPNRTSPYEFYQFWLNTADADVSRFLRTFTLMERAEIEALEAAHAGNPGAREAHRALARHMTDLLHGATEREKAEGAARALFSGDVRALDYDTLVQIARTLPADKQGSPAPDHPAGIAALRGGGVRAQDLIAASGVCASNREIKEGLAAGAFTIQGTPVTGPDQRFGPSDLAASAAGDAFIALVRRGKKTWGSIVLRG